MSNRIDTLTPPSSNTGVPVRTKVLENAVITGAAEQCERHNGEKNTLVRQYEAMLAAAKEARDKFVDAARSILKFDFEEATDEDIDAMFDSLTSTNS